MSRKFNHRKLIFAHAKKYFEALLIRSELREQNTAENKEEMYFLEDWVNPRPLVLADLQGDQLNMAVFLWYLVISDLSSVHNFSYKHWTRHLLQYKVPEKLGHV